MKTLILLSSLWYPTKWIPYLFVFLAGCATNVQHEQQASVETEQNSTTPLSAEASREISVIRRGRYRLVEIGAEGPQKDLLSQIIDLTIPALPNKPNTSVADAMRHVLLNSGYQLCHTQPVSVFENFPLPIVHHHLGPITVREALSVLAGSGWHLQVDDFNRKICFAPVQATDHSAGNEPVNEGDE